jgi:hypothetical protein
VDSGCLLQGALHGAIGRQAERSETQTVTVPPETLEALVKDELRQPVAALVRRVVVELVREQLSGAAETGVSGPENTREPRLRPRPKPKPAPSERRCNRCGDTKPAGEYSLSRELGRPGDYKVTATTHRSGPRS